MGIPRGFQLLNADERKAMASLGGITAHIKGTAHEFTSDEATVAGRKGGRAGAAKRMAYLEGLKALGFDLADKAEKDEAGRQRYRVRCSQCETLVINGVPCHETGCPNIRNRSSSDENRVEGTEAV